METERLMTAPQVAAYLNLKLQTIYSLTMRKRIPFIRIGGAIRFKKSELDEYLQQHSVEPVAS